jgi:hypothetical protein
LLGERAHTISSEIAIQTEHNTDDIKTLLQENTEITSQVRPNTDLLDEIHLHMASIAKKIGAEFGHFPPGQVPTTARLEVGEEMFP